MLEPLAGALFERLTTILPEGQGLDRSQLEADDLPPLASQYLLSLLDLESSERLATAVSLDRDWFDVGASALKRALRDVRRAAMQQARFPSSARESTLRRASREVVAHVVRPVHATAGAVFSDGSSSLPADEILERIRFFTAYEYLTAAAERLLHSAGESDIDREGLEELIRRADAEASKDWSGEEWLEVLAPLKELISAQVDDSTLPVRLLSMFFADKGRDDLVSRLVRYESDAGQESIAAGDLSRLIEGTLLARATSETVATESPAAAEPIVGNEPTGDSPASLEPNRSDQDEAASGPEPLWKRYQRHLGEPIGPPSGRRPEPQTASAPESESRDDILIEDRSQQPLWQRFRSASGPTKEDLELAAEVEGRVLGNAVGQRGEFIRDLFGGSEDRYVLALTVLEEAEDWTEASHFIADQIFRKHRINIYSSAAVQFTNAVEARFRATNPAG
jgi:hypothetical protein